eukprot:scaffold884_cov398-Prasinococcus_capsulatus_cf.AAC.22
MSSTLPRCVCARRGPGSAWRRRGTRTRATTGARAPGCRTASGPSGSASLRATLVSRAFVRSGRARRIDASSSSSSSSSSSFRPGRPRRATAPAASPDGSAVLCSTRHAPPVGARRGAGVGASVPLRRLP